MGALAGAIVVSGGASGIGRATALACARDGAPVAVLDLDPGAAEAAAQAALAAGAPAATGLACDVRDEASVAAAIVGAAQQLGVLRGLVTSAGIDRGGLAHELELATWSDVIATNLTGTFLLCKHVLRQMLDHAKGGSIVCVSSPWSVVSAPGGVGAYCASKGGVSALVRSLALDYAAHGIRVNGVLPGATETPLMWGSIPAAEVPALRRRIGDQLAVGRLAEPEEIASAIVWLLGDQAAYATGSHLTVDGGLLARASIEA